MSLVLLKFRGGSPQGSLFGTAVTRTVAIGALTLTLALSGAAVTRSAAIAALNETESLSGVAVTRTVATGAMTGAGALSGTAVSRSTAIGALTGTGALSGTAVSGTYAVGGLTEAEALAGVAVARTAAVGALTGSGDLSGAAIVRSLGIGEPGQSVAPVPAVEASAGRVRRPALYFVTIDGQRFERASLASALHLLNEAKRLAQQKAIAHVQAALTAQQGELKPIAWPKLELPKIAASSRDLRAAVTETKREIKGIYERAALDAEIAILLALEQHQRDDDDALTLLM